MKSLQTGIASIVAALAIVASGGQALVAQDDSAADIADLKKRVADLEDKLASSGGMTAGIDAKGKPFLKSADGSSSIKIGGRIQARYTYQGRDVNRGDRDGSDRSWGELERARIRIEGTLFDPRFAFRAEWDGHSDGGSLGLTDAYVQYINKNKDAGRTVKVGAGQWKPYFGRQEKQSSAQQLLIDRSLANEFFNLDRNIGVWVEGTQDLNEGADALFNRLGFEFGVSNGFDSVNHDVGDNEFDQIPAVIAHLDLDVFGNLGKYAMSAGDYNRIEKPGLTVGASFASDSNNGSGGSDPAFVEYDVYQSAFDFVFKYAGFSLNGEWFGRWLDFEAADVAGFGGDTRGDALFSHGGFIETGYMVTDKLQIVGRSSAVWNKEGPADGNAFEGGGGVNYLFNGHHLKLGFDVLYLDIPPDMPTMTEKLPGLGGSKDDPPFSHASFSSSSANLSEFQGIMVRTQLQIYF